MIGLSRLYSYATQNNKWFTCIISLKCVNNLTRELNGLKECKIQSIALDFPEYSLYGIMSKTPT